MTKTEDRLAAFKARDQEERVARAELDAVTLDKITAQAQVARDAAQALEALCGDLVSEFSHHAIKMQAPGGASVQIGNVLALAEQSRADIGRFLDTQAAPEA